MPRIRQSQFIAPKKTKKFWIPKIDIFASKEDCDRFFKGHNDYKGAIEVEI